MDRSIAHQAFVAREANGAWRAAIEVPGTGKLNEGETRRSTQFVHSGWRLRG